MDSWIRNQEEVFGRGLNLGQQREKERIIKLLEEWPICDESCYCYPCELGETEIIRKEFKSAIALIKGEK